MKRFILVRTAAILGLLMISSAVQADEPPRHEHFRQAILACQNSELNTAGVVFPEPTPGQRPELTDAQRALFEQCAEAGIIPPPPHGRHFRPDQKDQASSQQ